MQEHSESISPSVLEQKTIKLSGRIRRLNLTVPFTFRRLEGGVPDKGNGSPSPPLGLLAETRRLEPVFLARFQLNLASRMLGPSFLAFGPFLRILEF